MRSLLIIIQAINFHKFNILASGRNSNRNNQKFSWITNLNSAPSAAMIKLTWFLWTKIALRVIWAILSVQTVAECAIGTVAAPSSQPRSSHFNPKFRLMVLNFKEDSCVFYLAPSTWHLKTETRIHFRVSPLRGISVSLRPASNIFTTYPPIHTHNNTRPAPVQYPPRNNCFTHRKKSRHPHCHPGWRYSRLNLINLNISEC